ncbi:MAG: glutamine synthetase family protein [Salinisphaera sp.]|nr:glutamine synthetase family protein [Salinisphaera sp.]
MSGQEFTLPKDTHTVALGVGDLNGIMRGKRVPASHWPKTCESGNALSLALFAINMNSDVWDTPYANMGNGYPDMHIFPISEPVSLPWEPGVAIAMARAQGMDHKPVPIDPRNALIAQVERAAAMGYEVQTGTELEFYLLDPKTRRPVDRGNQVYTLSRAAEIEHVIGPIRRQLNEIGIPIEQSNPEYAPGQVEVNIRYDEALLAADRVVMFRSLVKQLAAAHGYLATFMAKPFADQSGSGFHVHYSLRKNGQNAFAENGKLNQTGRHFVAGLMDRMAETTLCGSSTPNAFRRIRPDTFCPINVTWGPDNRTVAVRIVEGEDAAVRVEKRDAAADCNPYILLATGIASGLDGMEKGEEPPAMTTANAYEDENSQPIPNNIDDAIRAARASEFMQAVLGADLHELYVQQSEQEVAFFRDQISEVETDRYIECL